MKIFKTKIKKFLLLTLILNVFTISTVFGQMVLEENEEDAIFPFETSDSVNVIDEAEELAGNSYGYSEDFYEVTDYGIYDADGNVVEIIESDEDTDQLILDDNAYETLNLVLADSVDEENTFEAYRDSIISNWGGKLNFTKRRLQEIQENLEDELKNFGRLGGEITSIEEKIAPVQKEINTLNSHVELLNQQLAFSKRKIKDTEVQIAEREVEIRGMMWDLKKSAIKLDVQRSMVLDYIYLVYNEEEKFLDYFDKGSSTLKLLLADNSVSENLLGKEYSKILEETGRKVFYDLYAQKLELEDKQIKVLEEKAKMDMLHRALNQEKRLLEEGKAAKKKLLDETRGQEEVYQELLELSQKQQLESAMAIQNMKDNISYIENKLILLDESIQKLDSLEEEGADQIEIDGEAIEEEIENVFEPDPEEESIPGVQPFIWPVEPRAITAYFHDPTYPRRWGVHNAVDVRAKQYTEIRAPANAYVFQAKDNGMGYSYIILAHKNKLVTVYGHVTEILVRPGTVVKQGEIIGLSGGTPGTKGAGWQTTGPHLHFEVWHKGQQSDPLDWLPVYDLPIEYIPDRFLAEAQ